MRIVLDSKCRIPEKALVLNQSAKTLIITTKGNEKEFDGNHIEIIGCRSDNQGLIDLQCALNKLSQKGIKKLLVEGGGTVIWNFLQKKLFDDLYIYIGPYIVGGKDTPTVADGSGIRNEDELISLELVDTLKLGTGILVHYRLIK